MAFLNAGNGQDFARNFVVNQKVEKKVSTEEWEQLYKAEERRQKEWNEWNDFQRNYRASHNQLDEEFQEVDASYRVNNMINDMNFKSIHNSYHERTHYVARLDTVQKLLTDYDTFESNGQAVSAEQLYDNLLEQIQKDAFEEVVDKINLNKMKLDINGQGGLKENNEHYLDDMKREKVAMETEELQNLLDIIDNGQFTPKKEKADVLSLCHGSAIQVFKGVYSCNFVKKNEDLLDFDQMERKI